MNTNANKIRTAVIGANGYSGRELAKLLLKHPYAELVATFGRDPEWQLAKTLFEPAAEQVAHYPLTELKAQGHDLDVIFLATPIEFSLEWMPELYQSYTQVIDLSGAFRLDAASFNQCYGQKPADHQLLSLARYGLCPWWMQATKPCKTTLIANPGCYPTAVLMALLPILKANLINPKSIIIDAKSGVSGAGKKLNPALLFGEMHDNCYPYKIGHHQHTPEIARYIQQITGSTAEIIFVTHLLPIIRGLNASIYAEFNSPYLLADENEMATILQAAYQNAYAHYPLVKHAYIGAETNHAWPMLLEIKNVVGTPMTHIAYKKQGQKLLLFSSIDNLLKGAASQAIENLNVCWNLPITTGLM